MSTRQGKSTRRISKLAAIVSILMVCVFSLSPVDAGALNAADVALYNDSIAPSGYAGAWQDGITAIKNMLTTLGITYEEVNYNDLNYSTQDFSSLYKIILIPGGYAQWYNYWISKTGKERIRNFVKNGGGYFGICAGSFFAVDRAVWEGTTYDDNAGYNAYGELTGYDLDLFPGTGTGPINEIADWNGERYNMTTINFQNENTVLANYKPVPYTEDILYYGGPYFSPDSGSGVDVLATYNYNGQPAIIAFNYGSGKVVLSGPHFEIEEDSDRDGVTIDREDEMDDNGSDWELVLHILNWLMPEMPSCPSLYFWNGTDYERRGWLFPGAMPREKEYRDHIPLNQLVLKDGQYYLQIRETEPENSFIDIAKLIIVDHSSNIGTNAVSILKETVTSSHINISEKLYKGRSYSATGSNVKSLSPVSAIHSKIGDVLQRLRYSDNSYVKTFPGDIITLTFPYVPLQDEVRDFIFVGEGYYVPLITE